MEPGPAERHESDTAAAPATADGPDVAGKPGTRRTPERESTASGGDSRPSKPAAGESVAPKPRTRRGWMSDSPLDGGSGWPTSAYAIIRRPEGYLSANGSAPASTKNGAEPLVEKIKVPQQTFRHAGVEAATADPEPPDTIEQSDAGTTGKAPRSLAIAGALIVLLALAVVVFFAVRGNRTDANAPASSTPTVTANVNTVVEPDTSTAVSFAPETTTSVAGDVLRAGSVRLSIGSDGANESFDLDSGAKGASSTFTGEPQPDLDALTQELRAVHGAHVA